MVVMFVGLMWWGWRAFSYYSYCRNPTGWEIFVPAQTLIGVFLKITDLKSAKSIRKPLGHYPRPRQIVDFKLDALDGRSMSPSWFEPKTNDSDWARSIHRNKSTQPNGIIKMIPLWWGNSIRIYLPEWIGSIAVTTLWQWQYCRRVVGNNKNSLS
jgi:hypothetical protein